MGLLAALPWGCAGSPARGGPGGVWLRSTPPGRPLRGPNVFLTQPWRAGQCRSPSPCPPERPSPGLPLGSGAGGWQGITPLSPGTWSGTVAPTDLTSPFIPLPAALGAWEHLAGTANRGERGTAPSGRTPEARPGRGGARGWPLSRGWQGGGPSLGGGCGCQVLCPARVGTARTPVTLFPSSLIFAVPPMLFKPPPQPGLPPRTGAPRPPTPGPGVHVL